MKAERFQRLKKLTALHKVLYCSILAIAVFFITGMFRIDLLSHIMISWNTFSLVVLIIDWIIFYNTTSKQIREQAKVEDSSRVTIFIIIIISTLASLSAVALLLLSSDEKYKALHVIVAIMGMTLSWIMVHTIFAVRYAHMYYGDHKSKENTHAGGLDFPNDELQKSNAPDNPDFLDFAYFSFVVGMTFQVSDIQITSKQFRRFVLLHGLLSFVYNTVIVALTINTLAGLRN
jgi:uncharacterized membrane protein